MIPHNKPTLGTSEMQAAIRVINSGWVAQGREVKHFEDELCEFLGLPEGHAVAVSSGTAALFLAVEHLKSDKLGYPVYGCSSLRNAILMAGCDAIPMDVMKEGPNLDIIAAERQDVGALIVAHTFGIPADIREVVNKPYIEDAAQALGARIENKSVGTFGAYGIFSFSATKLITSGGQGGAIVSSDKGRIDEIRDYREFDMRDDIKARFNFQMTDLQASVGRVQLRRLNDFLERREEIFRKYIEAGFDMMQSTDSITFNDVRYRAVIRTERPIYLISKLAEADIKAIIPIEEFELGPVGFHPHAFKLSYNTVSLPIYPSLTDHEVEKIITVVKGALCL